jgi:hypothetical protein
VSLAMNTETEQSVQCSSWSLCCRVGLVDSVSVCVCLCVSVSVRLCVCVSVCLCACATYKLGFVLWVVLVIAFLLHAVSPLS